ncbi:MAG: efflux RND transporter periplasmic adaptor subunit [SAR324 cluster bacterium]|nr:efflux RND transporter periplasmic adaptor subunit [SAR324 cluster bacterium]
MYDLIKLRLGKSSQKLSLLSLSLLLLLSAASPPLLLAQDKAKDDEKKKKNTTPVEIMVIAPNDLSSYATFKGKVIPSRYTTVRASQAGYVEKILVNEGDMIKSNQSMIHIDRLVSESMFKLAKANLADAIFGIYQAEINLKSQVYSFLSLTKLRAVAKREWENELLLFEQGLSAQLRLDRVEAGYQSTEAKYQSVYMNLNGATEKEVLALNLIDQGNQQLNKGINKDKITFSVGLKNEPISLSRALNSYERAKSNYKLALNSHNRSLGKAPFNGQVLRRLVDNGEYVTFGKGLFVFGDLASLEISVYLTAKDTKSIKVNDKVQVSFDSYSEFDTEGKIKSIAWDADPANHSYRAIVVVPNKQRKIRSGDRASVKIKINDIKNQISLPLSAILSNAKGSYVYIVDGNNIATQRSITKGNVVGNLVQVNDGLNSGDKVVIRSQQFLKNNDLVTVISR